ncbi:MAG: DUF805 domain-containing protein [Stappiaceae bacterium]
MRFSAAVRTCLRHKYFTFSGRASRSEYWFFMLFTILISIAIVIPITLTDGQKWFSGGNFNDLFSGVSGIFSVAFILFWLAVILPTFAVTVRRFHDVSLSGWWYGAYFVVDFIPYVGEYIASIAGIAVFVVTVLKGTTGENKYGPDPLGEKNMAEVFA